MRLGRYRYAAYFLLVMGAVLGLYYSHRFAYGSGARAAGRPPVIEYIHKDEDADSLHLYYSVLAMQVYARYPADGSESEQIGVYSLAKMQANMVAERVIPQLRKEGRTDEADRLAERVRDARTLIDALKNKQKKKSK
jgi:hypothetical protein